MKAAELRGMEDRELVHRVLELDRELVARRFMLHTNNLEDTASLRRVRRDIARIKTELRRREIAEGLPKGALIARHAVGWTPPELEAGGEAMGASFLSRYVDSGEARE